MNLLSDVTEEWNWTWRIGRPAPWYILQLSWDLYVLIVLIVVQVSSNRILSTIQQLVIQEAGWVTSGLHSKLPINK